MLTCPTCNGTGAVEGQEMRWSEELDRWIPIIIPEQCPDCEGDGLVSIKDRREIVRALNADADYEEMKLNEK